jgi:hypothetical protein
MRWDNSKRGPIRDHPVLATGGMARRTEQFTGCEPSLPAYAGGSFKTGTKVSRSNRY